MSKNISMQQRQPRSLLLLCGFLVVVIGAGAFIGTQTTPGAWYDALDKPPFNPPSWVFAPVWFTLYVLIAIAGWRTALREGFLGAGMSLWGLQMVLNWAWSPAFFTAENLWLAVLIILPMLATILAFIAYSWLRDRLSAWLFVPYALWVGFASFLNISLAALN
ncbi:TspO/MBR family protein [Pelagibacterium sediminicola]|uniref:TspO/MBR family protein n=1 Tax=Pelagibacterium sediminicola TaxID=2248761 RepID=UPI000E3184EF|nr:TspO/MBR family protein [Pelagibacterium sediminicola]